MKELRQQASRTRALSHALRGLGRRSATRRRLAKRAGQGAAAARSGASPRTPRRRVAVLLGGVSREREVSMKSGRAVIDALTERGYDVTPLVIDTSDENALSRMPKNIDVAFIALHGRFGEDGGIQTLLARRGVPFTGAGPAASAIAFDKLLAKQRLRAAGLPVPEHVALRFPWSADCVDAALDAVVRYPVVVKPCREGSSIGVTIAEDRVAARAAIEAAKIFEDHLLIEDYIPGREFTVPLVSGLQLPLVETVTDRKFFDYDAKYKDKTTGYHIAPELPPCCEARMLKVSQRAHAALGCDPFSRVDLRLDDAGRPWILELNTIPGLTATSLLPKAAAAAGVSFPLLCERMVELAAVRLSSFAPQATKATP